MKSYNVVRSLASKIKWAVKKTVTRWSLTGFGWVDVKFGGRERGRSRSSESEKSC